MNKMNRIAVCAVVLLAAMLPAKLVWSADEAASVAQVYLEFDPVTGEFKSVPATPDNSPDGNMMPHAGGQTATQADAQSPAVTSTAAPADSAQTTAPDAAATGGNSQLIIGLIVALAIVGGIVMMTRKKTA